mgnify:CR=1 FL=1
MVRIVIDSACDMELSLAEELGLDFMPLKTIFGEDEYLDGVTISHEQFFEKLVVITLSSLLSGTYQSATIAASDYEDCITVIDSLNVCIGEQNLVMLAVRLRDQGLSAVEIASQLEDAKHRVKVLAVFDTLEYLKRGGRISKTAAWAGNVLSIKPVISIEKGEVAILGKARGSKNGNNMLIQQINQSNGIDFSMPYTLAYSGLSDVLLKKYITDSSAIWEGHTDSLPVSTIGATIGTHAGPGAIAVSYFECK